MAAVEKYRRRARICMNIMCYLFIDITVFGLPVISVAIFSLAIFDLHFHLAF
jgi:hypothetical protein